MTALPPNRDAVLRWGIRTALLSYMSRDPDFEIVTEGGATFSLDSGVRMSGRVDPAGVLRMDGSVVLRAHHGALTVPLVGVEITVDALTIDDPAAEADERSEGARDRRPDRLTLVRFEPVLDAPEGMTGFSTRLAGDADALFGYNYLPDTPFDPLWVSFDPV